MSAPAPDGATAGTEPSAPAFDDDTLVAFVLDEAELLDAGRLDEWLARFADDGVYWMPLAPGQTDARLHASLLHEDVLLLRIRIERLRGARTFSQQPPSRGHHLLQTPRVVARDAAAGRYRLRTAFHFVETRGDEQQLYAGWATHDLGVVDGALRMRVKRVDLVNADAAFGSIQLLM